MKNILSFLVDLSRNNNRDWFTENKTRYKQALEEFREFTLAIHAGITSFDPELASTDPMESIFRIYKDVRFSKDKSPYKTHFGCWLTRGGRKFNDAGYYFHLQPGASFMAAGVHAPPADLLKLIRQEILFNPGAFLNIIEDPAIVERYERGGEEDKLKKGPAGFPKDFEHMEQLKYKHQVFSRNYNDKQLMSPGFLAELTKDYRGLHPLVAYLNEAMSLSGNE